MFERSTTKLSKQQVCLPLENPFSLTIGFQIASLVKEKCLHYKLHSKNSVTE